MLWLSHKSPISQDTLQLSLESEEVTLVEYNDIPLMQTLPFNERSGVGLNVEENDFCSLKNPRKMADMMKGKTFLILRTEYDVQARRFEGTTQKGRRATTSNLHRKRLSREFNVVEVAGKTLSAYTGMSGNPIPSAYEACQGSHCVVHMSLR